jgi:hypothetical protein
VLVNGLPEGVFTPRLVDSYWAIWSAVMVCKVENTRNWVAAKVPTLVAWKGSRLKMAGLDALPTYKIVVVWFPCPVEDTKRYFQWLHRLNQGLDTRKWRVYEHRKELNLVRLVFSINTTSVTAL